MAAILTTRGKLPEGAIKLTESEARHLQWENIKNWPNWIDVWPFYVGIGVLTGLGGATSLRINNAIRSKLKMGQLGKVISHYPVILGSMILSAFSHQTFVTGNLMIFQTSCPVCIETKAVLLQLGSCVLYPSIFSTLSNCVLANRYGTYRVPYWSDWKSLMKLYLKVTGPLRNKLGVYIVLNVFAASYITYSEGKSLQLIQRTLVEQTLDESKKL